MSVGEVAWGALLPTVLLMELTPGPNMAYLALTSATVGRRAGLATTAGIALGLVLLALAAAVGLTALLQDAPLAASVLRWAGIGYLLLLALATWRSQPAAPGEAPARWPRYLWHGLVTNVLSPKSALVFVTVLPSVVLGGAPSTRALLLVALVYVAIATAIHLVIVAAASALHGWLADPRRQRQAQRIAALMLVLAAGWLAWTTRGPW